MTAPEIVLPVLFTDEDGRARWREQAVSLRADSPQVWLSALAAASGVQWRESPVGFASGFHCTTQPQWLVVLQGVMEIGLRDGSWQRFGPGECFYKNLCSQVEGWRLTMTKTMDNKVNSNIPKR